MTDLCHTLVVLAALSICPGTGWGKPPLAPSNAGSLTPASLLEPPIGVPPNLSPPPNEPHEFVFQDMPVVDALR